MGGTTCWRVRNGAVERCTVAAFPAALREINRPKAKTERIIAVSNQALPAGYVVRPSIIPKRWQLYDQSIRREDVVMPEVYKTEAHRRWAGGPRNSLHRRPLAVTLPV